MNYNPTMAFSDIIVIHWNLLIHNLSKKGIKAPNPLVGSPWLKSGFMSQAYYVLEGKSRSRRAFKQICVNSVLKSPFTKKPYSFTKLCTFSVKLSHFWPITFSFVLNWWKLIALKRVVSQIVELEDLVPPHFEREKFDQTSTVFFAIAITQ